MNESVQASSLFKKAMNTLLPKGLKSGARNRFLSDIAEADEKVVKGMVKEASSDKKMNKLGKKSMKKFKSYLSKQEDVTPEMSNAIFNRAMSNEDNLFGGITNNEQAQAVYEQTMKDINKQAFFGTAKNMASDYYVDPIKNGQYGVAAGRIGATAGVVGVGAAALNYGLSDNSDDYQNY